LLALHPGLRRRSGVACTYAILALAVVGGAFYGPISTRLFDSKDDATFGREMFIEDATALIDDAPAFGSGLNGYSYNVRDFMKTRPDKYEDGWIPPVHNIYYLWWAETGYVGLAVFLFMWAWIIWIGIQNLRVQDQIMFVANAASLSGMLAFMVDGYFSFTLRVTPTLKEFWALASLIMAVQYWRRHAAARPLFSDSQLKGAAQTHGA
jgi:O-antigen ligase